MRLSGGRGANILCNLMDESPEPGRIVPGEDGRDFGVFKRFAPGQCGGGCRESGSAADDDDADQETDLDALNKDYHEERQRAGQ